MTKSDLCRMIVMGTVKSIDERETDRGEPALSMNVLSEWSGTKTWVRCSAFGSRVRYLKEVVKIQVGDLVIIDGFPLPGPDGNPKVWEGPDGRWISTYEIKVQFVTLLEPYNE